MKIKKNAFSCLVLEFICQSKFSCKRSKIQKSTPPIAEPRRWRRSWIVLRLTCPPTLVRTVTSWAVGLVAEAGPRIGKSSPRRNPHQELTAGLLRSVFFYCAKLHWYRLPVFIYAISGGSDLFFFYLLLIRICSADWC
jgi:hypothetical protein